MQWLYFENYCHISQEPNVPLRFLKCHFVLGRSLVWVHQKLWEPWYVWQYSLMPVNSLAPGKFEWNFRYVCNFGTDFSDWLLRQLLWIALIWMSLDFTDDQSTLVQVMAWCRQATSHYLSQCGPRSLSPYGVTRPQWVNASSAANIGLCQCNHLWPLPTFIGCYWGCPEVSNLAV